MADSYYSDPDETQMNFPIPTQRAYVEAATTTPT